MVIWRLFALPNVPASLFAATDGGVFLSKNSGETWTSISTGLPSFTVYAVTVAPDDLGNQYLLAGTAGRGVWKRSLSEVITSLPIASSTVPSEFALAQNYPNPFNPNTVIRYSIPGSVKRNGILSYDVTLRVYNLLGQEVATLVNGNVPPGTYQALWNADGMPSGTYFYTLRANGFTSTMRMTLLR
jgi:hypothetical protein